MFTALKLFALKTDFMLKDSSFESFLSAPYSSAVSSTRIKIKGYFKSLNQDFHSVEGVPPRQRFQRDNIYKKESLSYRDFRNLSSSSITASLPLL